MENTIKVLKIEVGQPPCEKEIGNDLKSLQAEVGGLIEVLPLDDDSLLICNEEGKINGMEANRWVGDDIICGPFFICGDSGDGDFASLAEEQLRLCKEQFADIPTFTGDEIEREPKFTFIGFGR